MLFYMCEWLKDRLDSAYNCLYTAESSRAKPCLHVGLIIANCHTENIICSEFINLFTSQLAVEDVPNVDQTSLRVNKG